jgi:hypothetical protein
MISVVPYRAAHLLELQLQDGQLSSTPAITPVYAVQLEGEFAFTAFYHGKILAVGGVLELWKNRGQAWTMIDRSAGKHFLELHHAVKRMLDIVPYRRIEADTACEFEQGHRWLKALGFQLEAPRMKAHRIDGGDSALYARVR